MRHEPHGCAGLQDPAGHTLAGQGHSLVEQEGVVLGGEEHGLSGQAQGQGVEQGVIQAPQLTVHQLAHTAAIAGT